MSADHDDNGPQPGSGGAGGETFHISELAEDALGGCLGLAACPGYRDGRFHPELLVADLDRVADWGAAAVICLLEPGEVEAVGLDRLSFEVRRRGIGWLNLPIRDHGLPGPEFERDYGRVSARLAQALGGGNRVLVHCFGGLGRTGLFAARLLIEAGMAPDRAIAKVRTARPGAIETSAQEAYLRGLAPGTRG